MISIIFKLLDILNYKSILHNYKLFISSLNDKNIALISCEKFSHEINNLLKEKQIKLFNKKVMHDLYELSNDFVAYYKKVFKIKDTDYLTDTFSIKVSIVIPTYNVEHYIESTIKCLLNQTFLHYEVIFVDDCSSDRTTSIISSNIKNLKNFTLILNNKNLGAGACRNIGLNRAHGKYIMFLDADDLFEPILIEKAYTRISSQDADICVFNINQFNSNKQIKCFSPSNCFVTKNFPIKEPFLPSQFNLYVFNTFQNWTWNKIFNTNFIRKNNISFQEIQKTNDLLFVSKALVLASRIVTLNEILVHYRKGNPNSIQANNDEAPLCFLQAFDALEFFLKEKGLYERYKISFLNKKIDAIVYNLFSVRTYASFSQIYLCVKGCNYNCYTLDSIYNINNYKKFLNIFKMNLADFTSFYKLHLK